jgi:methionyl-tRNA formyltransferase
MRVVFMGSPAFGVPSLRRLISHFDVAGVVTQPDRPAGRGRRLRSSEVKLVALEASLPVFQPARLNGAEVVSQLRAWGAEVIVVAAFGQLIPPSVLELPPHGCLNVHPSLLPRWRGASPIQTAILNGDQETGITIMKLDVGLDTGPIVAQRRVPLDDEVTGGDLSRQLAELGASVLIETLPKYITGEIRPVPQDQTRATYAPTISKSAGELDFNKPAAALARQVRAYEPRPASFLRWAGRRLLVRRARVQSGGDASPGEVLTADGYPAVATTDGVLVLEAVQPEGKGVMDGKAFVRGAPSFAGASLATKDVA